MKAISQLRGALAFFGAVAFASPVLAADIVGTWQRADGKVKIRMSPCGGAVCGHIAWLISTDTPAKVGQQVFMNLKEDGGAWAGSAFNPEDGKTYTAKVSASGASMTTKGCVMGGMLCKSVNWTKAN